MMVFADDTKTDIGSRGSPFCKKLLIRLFVLLVLVFYSF